MTRVSPRAGRGVGQQQAEMETSHAALLGALADAAAFDAEILGESTWFHYDEHTAQVKAWKDAS